MPVLVCGFCPMNGLQLLTLFGAGAGAAIGQFGITWAYRFAEPRQIEADHRFYIHENPGEEVK